MKVLVFSDCYIYGGSEKLMAFLFKNDILNKNFILSYAYRKHKDYQKGMKNEDLLNKKNIYPLCLLSNETLFHKINTSIKINFLRNIIKVPFFIVEKIGLYFIWNLIGLIYILLKTKPDIVHINNGGYPGAKTCNIMVVANYLSVKAKMIYQVNNQARSAGNYFERVYDKFVNENIDFFINASNKAKQQLIEKRNFNSDKILVVNNCVPLPEIKLNKDQICIELNIPQESFLIVEVAFLSKRKGQKYLIDSLFKLFEKQLISKENVYCAFVGNGEEEEFLKNYIKELDLTSNILLLGYRSNSEDFIAASDLFVLPSISDEDMPLVLLSALGYGKPIIATDFAGISQVIESNKNGILINNNLESLSDDLASQILHLYRDDSLRSYLGINAKEKYTEFDPTSYGLRLKKIYEGVYGE